MPPEVPAAAEPRITRVFRAEYGRAVAVLISVFGDVDVAEEAVQDAFAAAVERWPSQGIPPSPAGWIITTARHRAIDRLRREASRPDRHAQAALLQAGAAPGRCCSRPRCSRPRSSRPVTSRPRRAPCAMTGCG